MSHRLKVFFNRRTDYLLISLGFLDLIFIILHVIYRESWFSISPLFSLERDNGYAEIFQYFKIIIMIFLLLYLLGVTKSFGYLSWALIFLYFVSDDAFRIHERFGEILASGMNFSPPFNLRLQDIGELVVIAAMGFVLFMYLFWEYRHASIRFKRITHDLLLLVGVLLFFGVFIDLMHSAIHMGRLVRNILAVIEDGGEMIAMSLILWYVFILVAQKGVPKDYLHLILSKQDFKEIP